MDEPRKEIYNGGPAFPLDLKVGDDHRWGHGMYLRDYFAAAAMQGQMVGYQGQMWERIAKESYEMADAMIEQRTK